MKAERFNDEVLQDLANAVVITAIKDYAHALKRRQNKQAEELEEFFYSQDFEMFSDVDPEFIIEYTKANIDRMIQSEYRPRGLGEKKEREGFAQEVLYAAC